MYGVVEPHDARMIPAALPLSATLGVAEHGDKRRCATAEQRPPGSESTARRVRITGRCRFSGILCNSRQAPSKERQMPQARSGGSRSTAGAEATSGGSEAERAAGSATADD